MRSKGNRSVRTRVNRAATMALLAGAAGLALASTGVRAASLTWDPAASNGANPGGAGNWDSTSAFWFNGSDAAWPNATPNSDEAVFAGAAGGTVSLTEPINANILTFNTDGYTIDGNTLTMSGSTPTVNVAASVNAAITSIIAGTDGLTKNGDGVLTLSGTNTFSGGLNINGGQLSFTSDSNLGDATNAVNVTNATLSYVGTSGGPTIKKTINISGAATLNSAAAAGGGKWVLNNGGHLAGSGTLYKTGDGWFTVYGAAAAGSDFNTEIDGGLIELGNVTGLGSGSITINGGELSLNRDNIANEVYVNSGTSGTFAVDGGSYTYKGTLHADGDVSVRLGDFWGGTSRNLTFGNTSHLTGGGTISFLNSLSNNSTGQTLTLAGDNSGFTGTLNLDGGHGVLLSYGFGGFVGFNGKVVATATDTALPILGTGYDDNQPDSSRLIDNTGGIGGVYAYTGPGLNSTVDLSTLGGGNWYFGSQGGGTYLAGSIGVGAGNLYRLGGGGGKLIIANSNVVTGANDVNIGTAMVGGGGGVQFMSAQNYTGATHIVNGALSIGADNAIPSTTAITFGGTNGSTQYGGTLDVNGFTQTLSGPIAIASGADATKQVITNGSSGSIGTLILDTTAGATAFDGVVKDGLMPLAVSVQGSNPANGVVFSGDSVNYTGGTSIDRVSLTIGNGNGARIGGPVNFSNNGMLVLNSTANIALSSVSGPGQIVHSGSGVVSISAPGSFSGGITVNGGGTLSAGPALASTLGGGSITLSGGTLALKGIQSIGTTANPLAPVTVTGFNKDTFYGVGETGGDPGGGTTSYDSTSPNNNLLDGYFSYYQNGWTVPSGQGISANSSPPGTVLDHGGLDSTSITSAITNTVTGGNTPFQLADFNAKNTLQILGGSPNGGLHQGTLSLPNPTPFKNLAVLSVSSWASDDTPPMTINFTDGTSVTVNYNSFDWSVGGDATKQAADAIGGMLMRFSPRQSAGTNGPGGWDQRDFGLYETDVDLTNINGVDYSGKLVASITFTGINTNTHDQRTNIFAVSGSSLPVTTNASQTYSNDVSVTADSAIDISGSLIATLGNLSLDGAKLSVTSSDTTTTPYSLNVASTNVTGNATIDVANSAGGGAGSAVLGAVSGGGTLAKDGAGIAQASSIRTAGLSVNAGTAKIAANATPNSAAGTSVVQSLSIASGASLDLTNNSAVIDYTGSPGTLIDDVRQHLQNGRLTTSSGDSQHRLGYGDNAVLHKTDFAGQTPDDSSVLVKYTYGGDANLDGQVDVTDLGALATNWQTSNVWTGGDFNYDGFVDVTDLGILATDWQLGVGSPLGPGSLQAALQSVGLGNVSVPEPASIGLIGLGLVGFAARRRRRASAAR